MDASVVKEKGATGQQFRLHYALNIFNMCCAWQKITTQKIGESLCNFEFTKNQLVLADRAYSSIKGIEHIENAGSKYILRLKQNSFISRNDAGEKIELLDYFNNLKNEEIANIQTFITNKNGLQIPIRICAKKKDDASIEKQLKSKESKKQSCKAKTFNEYIVVVTNLDPNIPASEILELYRFRWQVEIYFKRLKSILDIGDIPKKNQNSTLSWLNGKIMIALLIENIIAKASFFPKEQTKQECMA